MAQFARPDADVTVTSFTNGFGAIDETPASDADFAYGANNTAAELEVSLGNPTDPTVSTGHVFRYRVAKTNAGTVDGTGNACTVTARLMQGTTQIATDTAKTVDGTWTQYAYTLSGAEADAITDYTDLRLEFVTSASGGSPANRRGGAVSWAELEVPDAAAPSGTGAITVPAATVSGTGEIVLTGTGAVSVPSATVAGTGAEVFTATGAVSVPAATVAGTGDHAAAADPSGTGAISVPSATVSGSGSLVLTGTGAITVPAATVSGVGAEVFTATGAIALPAATVAGIGEEVFTATGALTVPSATVAGDGTHTAGGGATHTGTGAISVPAATVAGTGNCALSGNTHPIPGVAYALDP